MQTVERVERGLDVFDEVMYNPSCHEDFSIDLFKLIFRILKIYLK